MTPRRTKGIKLGPSLLRRIQKKPGATAHDIRNAQRDFDGRKHGYGDISDSIRKLVDAGLVTCVDLDGVPSPYRALCRLQLTELGRAEIAT